MTVGPPEEASSLAGAIWHTHELNSAVCRVTPLAPKWYSLSRAACADGTEGRGHEKKKMRHAWTERKDDRHAEITRMVYTVGMLEYAMQPCMKKCLKSP